jgi:hypothetical protein
MSKKQEMVKVFIMGEANEVPVGSTIIMASGYQL